MNYKIIICSYKEKYRILDKNIYKIQLYRDIEHIHLLLIKQVIIRYLVKIIS
jgi:hypothetical protein